MLTNVHECPIVHHMRSYLREYGFSMREIAAHMGITKSRVFALAQKESKRVRDAVKEMKASRRNER